MTALTSLSHILRVCIVAAAAVLLASPHFAAAQTLPHTLPVGVIERHTCGGFSVDIRGFGAGMLHQATAVATHNRRVTFISPTENCAVVEWESETPAASAVIFAPFSDEPVTVDPNNEVFFGYPAGSTQNNAGASVHRAIITDLEPGVAYAYRTVTRAHPTATPTISEAHVLIAGPAVGSAITQPSPVNTSAQPQAPLQPTQPAGQPGTGATPRTFAVPVQPDTSAPPQHVDFEKFTVTPTGADTHTSQEQAPTPAHTDGDGDAPSTEDDTATTTPAAQNDTGAVRSALNAAASAFSALNSQEEGFFARVQSWFAGMLPGGETVGEGTGVNMPSFGIGLFESDRYIIPVLLALGALLLVQQVLLPALGIPLKNPLRYWIIGMLVLSVLAIAAMLYYVALVTLALFLGLLAWYLLDGVTDDAASASPKPAAATHTKALAAPKTPDTASVATTTNTKQPVGTTPAPTATPTARPDAAAKKAAPDTAKNAKKQD